MGPVSWQTHTVLIVRNSLDLRKRGKWFPTLMWANCRKMDSEYLLTRRMWDYPPEKLFPTEWLSAITIIFVPRRLVLFLVVDGLKQLTSRMLEVWSLMGRVSLRILSKEPICIPHICHYWYQLHYTRCKVEVREGRLYSLQRRQCEQRRCYVQFARRYISRKQPRWL